MQNQFFTDKMLMNCYKIVLKMRKEQFSDMNSPCVNHKFTSLGRKDLDSE